MMDIALIAALSLASAGIVFCVGYQCGFAARSDEAIEAGVARYTVDPKTGETTFEWVKAEK